MFTGLLIYDTETVLTKQQYVMPSECEQAGNSLLHDLILKISPYFQMSAITLSTKLMIYYQCNLVPFEHRRGEKQRTKGNRNDKNLE